MNEKRISNRIELQVPQGRVPPQAKELEEAVLGAMLLEKDRQSEVMSIIRSPDVFYIDAHQLVYACIQELYARGATIDLLTVTDALRKRGELDQIGGAAFLTRLTMSVISSAHVEAHARIVLEKWISREVIRICGKGMNTAYEDAEDVFDQLEQLEVKLAGITNRIRTGSIKRLGDSLHDVVEGMKSASHRSDGMVGLPTGLTKLDAQTRGLHAGNLTVIAASTGEGKTTLALTLAYNIARNTAPVGYFSLEMLDRELIWKMISSELQEDVDSVMSGNFSSDKWRMLEREVLRKLYDLNFYMYAVGGLNIIELKAIARGMVLKHGAKVLFVDYLQLIRGIPGKRYGTREQEVNEVSKELKALAMELQVPVVALSQVSRLEKGTKRMYQLSDLRESGAIENDASNVWFIYRPYAHKLAEFEGIYCTELDAFINIAKARLGQTGMFRVRFDGAFNKFSDYVDTPPDVFGDAKPFSPGISSARPVIDFTVPKSKLFIDEKADTPF